jgi:hypothetical protein
VAADAAKVVWAIGFPFDCTVEGKAVEITSMIDERARVSLLHLVERSITAELLVAELEGVLAAAGGPPELVSQALQQFCIGTVGLSYIPPRTPSNDRYIESFNNRATKGVPQPQPLDDPA